MGDVWEFYFTRIDGELGSIFFNESLESRSPVIDHRSLVYLRLLMRNPRPDGLSSQDEFDALKRIDDALQESLAGSRAIYAGRATYGGRRDFFFYTAEVSGTSEVLANAMARFAEYQFEIGSRDDPDWETYRRYLLPSARDRQRIENRKVCDALADNGDPLATAREIDHWAYFPDAKSRDAFVERVATMGYQVRDLTIPSGDRRLFGAQIYRVDHADWDAINGVTLELFELAATLGGEYDGWESPVQGSRQLH